MAAPNDPVATSSHIDLDKLSAAYSSKISYFDVLNVEARYHMGTSLCSGSSDSPHQTEWVMVADWHDLAYQEFLSMNSTFLPNLINIEARVKALLTQSPELADKYEPLKIFLDEYMKFLSLPKADFVGLSKNKCYLLMSLIKSFVAQFEDSLSSYEYGKQLISLGDLSQIPELQQRMIIKVLSSNPSLKSEPAFIDSVCQSEWVRLDDWQDLAHRELKAIRRVYLPQLLKAYERVCSLCYENLELSTKYLAGKIFLLEYCKFLTMSRASIVELSRGECYVLMMLIKNQLWQQLPLSSQSPIPEILDELDIRAEFVDPSLARESASSDPAHLLQSEWDVLAYQELQSLRNMHSSHLDKIYKMGYGLWSQSSLPKNNYESTAAAIERALKILSLSRADILDFSKEAFYDNVELFKAVVRSPVISCDHCEQLKLHGASMDSARLIQYERFTNLNDQLYEELQLMKKKHMPVLLKAYNKLNQSPAKKQQKVMDIIYKCFGFLEMHRSSLAVSSRDNHEAWLEFVETVVARCKIYLSLANCRSSTEQSSFGYREVEPNLYDMD